MQDGSRKPYRTPRIDDWGNVADLTGTGKTNPGPDAIFGSVTPAGKGPS
jgi:hypothetical protein